MSFKKGDSVICLSPTDPLVKRGVYTVESYAPLSRQNNIAPWLSLTGYPGKPFNADRFGKLEDAPVNEIIIFKGEPPPMPLPHPVAVSGASKNDQDKIDLALIPYPAMVALAKAFMVGEKKYGRYNYTKGHKATQLGSAALRHLMAWLSGEENDPVDGQPHLGSVMACCSMAIHQSELGTMKDDRFKPEGTNK